MLNNNSDLDNFLGHKIRDKRIKIGMTLSEVGTKIGVSHQQVQKYEQGQSRISASVLFKLSKLFGTKPEYFFEGYKPVTDNKAKPCDVINVTNDFVLNILIIEDDPSEELILRKAIEFTKRKTNLFCVHDGAKAMDFLRKKDTNEIFPRPDLIILDLNIPKFNGKEVLRMIKRDRDIQDIPVVIITNSISYKDMTNAYKEHVSGYICKSFDFEIFRKNILSLIEYWSNVVILPSNACC